MITNFAFHIHSLYDPMPLHKPLLFLFFLTNRKNELYYYSMQTIIHTNRKKINQSLKNMEMLTLFHTEKCQLVLFFVK